MADFAALEASWEAGRLNAYLSSLEAGEAMADHEEERHAGEPCDCEPPDDY